MVLILSKRAVEGKLDPVIGRTDEILRVIQILGRRRKNNPVLVGEPGVGKTAIVEGLALKMVEGNVPISLQGKGYLYFRIINYCCWYKISWSIRRKNEKSIVDELILNPHIIVFIDELHTLSWCWWFHRIFRCI